MINNARNYNNVSLQQRSTISTFITIKSQLKFRFLSCYPTNHVLSSSHTSSTGVCVLKHVVVETVVETVVAWWYIHCSKHSNYFFLWNTSHAQLYMLLCLIFSQPLAPRQRLSSTLMLKVQSKWYLMHKCCLFHVLGVLLLKRMLWFYFSC